MEELCGGHFSFCKHAVVNSQKGAHVFLNFYSFPFLSLQNWLKIFVEELNSNRSLICLCFCCCNSCIASVDKCEMACRQEVQRGADEFATVDKN